MFADDCVNGIELSAVDDGEGAVSPPTDGNEGGGGDIAAVDGKGSSGRGIGVAGLGEDDLHGGDVSAGGDNEIAGSGVSNSDITGGVIPCGGSPGAVSDFDGAIAAELIADDAIHGLDGSIVSNDKGAIAGAADGDVVGGDPLRAFAINDDGAHGVRVFSENGISVGDDGA